MVYWWHRVAARLGMSVRRAVREVGPREFLRWQLFLNLEEEDAARREWLGRSKSDHYSARLIWEVYLLRRHLDGMFSKTSMPPLSPDELLIRFTMGDDAAESAAPPPRKMSDAERRAERSLRSRMVWAALLGRPEILRGE